MSCVVINNIRMSSSYTLISSQQKCMYVYVSAGKKSFIVQSSLFPTLLSFFHAIICRDKMIKYAKINQIVSNKKGSRTQTHVQTHKNEEHNIYCGAVVLTIKCHQSGYLPYAIKFSMVKICYTQCCSRSKNQPIEHFTGSLRKMMKRTI